MQNEVRVMTSETAPQATVSLVAPPRNYWTVDNLTAFNDDVMALTRGGHCRCLVVTGAHADDDEWFSAGLHPAMLEPDDPLVGPALSRLFAQAFGALRRFPGVTIAAINGHASNEGVAWALNCDFRLCAEDARFQYTAGTSGLLPFGGSTQLLPRLIGESWAKRMIMTEERVAGTKALDLGLIDELVPRDQLYARVDSWAHQLLRQSPVATRSAKQLIEHARMRPLETGFAAERDWQAQIIESGDYREARRALAESRPPQWPNQ